MTDIRELINQGDNKKALIMALGPSLLDCEIEKYEDHVKFACNEFYRTPIEAEIDYFCMVNIIENILSITPKNKFKHGIFAAPTQTAAMLEEKLGQENYCWSWRDRELQGLFSQQYSEGASVGVHMIAYTILMGFDEVTIYGIDMTPTNSSHAGFDKGGTGYVANVFGKYWTKMVSDFTILSELAEENGTKLIYKGHNEKFKEIFK